MSKYQKHFLITIALVIAAVAIYFTKPFVPGLDIAGGMRVVMVAAPDKDTAWPKDPAGINEKMEGIRETIRKRVMGLAGVSEPVVYVQKPDRLVIELPGVTNERDAMDRIQKTATLKFYYLDNMRSRYNPMGAWEIREGQTVDGEASYTFTGMNGESINSAKQPDEVIRQVVGDRKPILTGADIEPNAKSAMNQRQQPVIEIQFGDKGTEIFRNFTREHVHEYLAVFLDNRLLTAPTISEPIPNGQAEVTGFDNLKEARQTAESLNAGALPVPLKVLTKDQVQPTLGQETIKQVIFAGIAGLILVILFMALYYRLPGIIADIALGLYTLFVIAVFKLFGATMSLAGVAALIISIGMAVDANILIFERLKEELRGGKTLKAAIDAGFSRAFTAIFDSNMCTAITCAILMWYGSPSVKSFALTLLVGVGISMFTAITVTRTILHLLVGWEWAQKPSLYGLGTSWMTGVKWNIVGKRNWFFALSALLIVPGIIAMFLNYSQTGTILKEGIEFKSGTSIQATFNEPVDQTALRTAILQHSKDVEVQMGAGNKAFIKTEPLNQVKEDELRDALDKQFGLKTVVMEKNPQTGKPQPAMVKNAETGQMEPLHTFDSVNSVEPTISAELKTNAFLSVLFASAAIVLFLTFRFAIGGLGAGLKFGVCAVIALIHDSLFILGLFAIFGQVLHWEIDSLFVTAVLTIIGFSVHDTIVVFDRIRENLRHRERGESFDALANKSIIQTLSRSINTSFTVVLTLSTLIAFGGPLLRHFYIAMLAGIIIGTYSSIFNATPLVVVWEMLGNKTAAEPKKKAFEDKALVEKPMEPTPGVIESTPSTNGGAEASDGSDADKTRIKRKTTKRKRF